MSVIVSSGRRVVTHIKAMPDIPPRALTDDGVDITIDVHGCTVEQALYYIDTVLEWAHEAGRMRVSIIHGLGGTDASTSIRQALREALAEGDYADLVSGSLEAGGGGKTDCSIRHRPGAERNTNQRLTLADLR